MVLELIDKVERINDRGEGIESLYFGEFLNDKNVEQELVSSLSESIRLDIKKVVNELERLK